MSLNDIVNVVITSQTQTVSEAGFGIPMILGTSVRFTDLIRFYSSMDEVALDFAPTDPEFVAAQDIFSQTISPEQIAIGRRQVDTVPVAIETAMTGEIYTITANGISEPVSSTSDTTFSVVTLNNNLVALNRIAVSLDGEGVGTVTADIKYSTAFTPGTSTITTINGVPAGAAVLYTASNAGTLTAIAAQLAGLTGVVASATSDGIDTITVVFVDPGTNSVDSSVTTGGSTPTAAISQGGFIFDTDTETTMQAIADEIVAENPTYTAVVSGATFRILTVQGPPNTTVEVDSFVVTGGASQAVATITNPLQPVTQESIAADIVAAINALVGYPVEATDNFDGTFLLTNATAGTPFSLKLTTSIINPNQARVNVTQIVPSQLYRITLNGIDFDYTAPSTVQTSSQIVAALVAIINASSLVAVSASDNLNGSLDIIADDLTLPFAISVSEGILQIQKGFIQLPLSPANSVSTDLTAINNANSTWYALINTSRDVQTVKDTALWVETRIKLFGTASSNADIINVQAGTDTTSIAAFLNQGGYTRTFVMYHQDAAFDYPEAAWFGRVLPLVPGSETWKFKTLNTVSYSNLTTTQSNNALAKKANTYEFIGGVNMTGNGTVAQGEYIDVIRGIDWLTARIQEFVFSVLVNNPKVPYTDAGVAVIQAEVMRALQLAVNNNFLSNDPLPLVTVPLVANVSPTDKANRILRNVKFTATIAGAIHAVRITGTVSV